KQGIKGTSSGGGTGGGSKDSGGSPGASSGQVNGLNLAAATNPDVGVQTPLLVLGASAGILFAGALLGLVFRRRRASKPSV
ncbi:MAG: hypothetical protein QOJ57_612, partial [Thermoleophilaceae bacterium]|nr:hypothetical protein [Thermoleophilaceae bacterium]